MMPESKYQELIAKIKGDMSENDKIKIHEAYDCATEAHEGQKRRDGSDYVTHPIAVAEIVAEMGLDAESLISALLHDCIEDTELGYDKIKAKFGKEVADIVEGVSKLTRMPYTSKEEAQIENLRKMFLAMGKDIRVILIKIADRLHNMRTIEFHKPEKQREKALETMEVYAPLAHRLGMQKVKWELEDRSLRCLDPVGYAEITEELEKRSEESREFLEHIKERLVERLQTAGIHGELHSRVKHIYSIYKKMYTQHKTIDEVYDLYAMRVIVDTVADCYNILGFIHDMYRPIPGRFKDYISTPKANMYQSLHTTVIGREGIPFEVQIRTHEMHHTAEYGIAAHWKYKSGVSRSNLEEKLAWVRQLMESQEVEDEDFVSSLKTDMFSDEVFVFTPKGDVTNLPAGSTPIDFAYSIHSAVGNRMSGAKVNGRIVQLDYKLQNGEIVEIITSNSGKGPSRDWINIARTSEARNKIKQWFKKECRDENIARGKSELDLALKREGINFSIEDEEDILLSIANRMSFKIVDDMFASLGYGGIKLNRVINRIRAEKEKEKGAQSEEEIVRDTITTAKRGSTSNSGVIVPGVENCLVKFARCCTPIPGDSIIGFITRGYGVSVHRSDCQNVTNAMKDAEDLNRWISVFWADDIKENFQTSLQLSAKDRSGLIMDIAAVLNNLKLPVLQMDARRLGDGYAIVNIVLNINGKEQLEFVMNKLHSVPGIIDVKRSRS